MEGFHGFVAAIDNLYANKPEVYHEPVCPKRNVRTIIIFLRLEDLSKARACYLTVKRYPLVLCTTEKGYASKMAEHFKYA